MSPPARQSTATWRHLIIGVVATVILGLVAFMIGGTPAAYAANANLPSAGVSPDTGTTTESLDAADGLVYVASRASNTVKVFAAPITAGSTPVRTLDMGVGAQPVGVTVDNGLLYVSNAVNGTVNAGWVGVYTAGGAGTSNAELSRITGLTAPRSVGVDDRYLYIVGHTAAGSIRVLPITASGPAGASTLRTITANLPWPLGTVVHNGRIYTALSGASNSVVVHTAGATAANVAVATLSGSMSNVFDVEVVGDLLLVANESNDSVNAYRLTDTGSVTPQWRIVGSATGLTDPSGLSYDNGTLYVAQRASGKIVTFSPLPENPAPVRSVGHSIPQSNSPWDVAIGGGYLYYPSGNANTIHRISLTGPPNGKAIATVASTRARSVAANDTYVYWTNGTEIGRARHGAAGIEAAFMTVANAAFAVEVDANYIYWTHAATGAIGRANLDGTGVIDEFIPASATGGGASGLFALTTSASHIYWSDGAGKRIGRASLDGTDVEPTFVNTGTVAPAGVAVNGTEVFYIARGGSTLSAARLGAPATVRLVTNQYVGENPAGLHLHDDWLYWAESDSSGEVMRVTTAGTDVMDVTYPVLDLAPGLGQADTVAVDNGFAYVADRTNDRVAVFSAGATGFGLPVRIITGVGDMPMGVAVADGLVYVATASGVRVYLAGGSGTSNTLQRTVTNTASQAVTVAGGEVFIGQGANNRVIVYEAGGTGTSNTELRILNGLGDLQGLAVHNGELFVASGAESSNAVRAFNATWAGTISTSTAGVVKRTISGGMISDPWGLAVADYEGQPALWVGARATNNVVAYPIDASGAARPLVSLSGSATGLNAPSGITFDSSGFLYVANAAAPVALRIFAPEPTISGIAAASGRPGDTVAITGTNFDGVSEVSFAGVPTAFTRVSSTQVNVTVPFSPAGPTDVVVATARGRAEAADAYTQLPTQPGEQLCVAAPALVNGNFDDYVPPTWSAGASGWVVAPQSTPGIGWKTTGVNNGQPDGIELHKNLYQPAASGAQSGELNAYVAGMIYQDLPTTPGQTLRWSLAHSSTATGTTNTMRVMIGDPDDTLVQSGPNISTNRKTWTYHTGSYTVPEGQTVTRFGFETVTPANSSVGNLIDDVTFTALGCPEAPSDLTATPEAGAARITFTPGSDGGDPVTDYAYSLDDGPWTATGSASSPVRIDGLVDGLTYSVRLRALNSTAAGQPSDPMTFTAGGPSLGAGGALNPRTVSTIAVADTLGAANKIELTGEFGATVHTTVTASAGSVALGTTTGLTPTAGFPSDFSGPTISFTGTKTAINTALATLTYTAPATAGPGTIRVTATAVLDGYAYNPANGHYYELITPAQTWAAARDDARSRSLYGTRGYLATITSAEENAIVNSLAGANSVWIGASDAESEGEWVWMDGPEAGQMFWSSAGCTVAQTGVCAGTGAYNNWAASNPSNSNGTEHYAELTGSRWNDLNAAATRAMVVEYSEPDGAPVTIPGATRTITVNTRMATVADDACVAAPGLVNGDFEATFPEINWLGAGANPSTGPGYKLVPQGSQNLGWSNTAVYGGQPDRIELWTSGFNGVTAPSGNQFAELNALVAGTFYQDLATTPGQTLRWSLSHRATPNSGATNTMRVVIGAAGGTLTQSGSNLVSGSAWTKYTGTYTVPAGQTTTRFAFQAVSPVADNGNLIDDIRFSTVGCAAAPSNVTAAGGNGFATVSFAAGDDGGYAPVNYAVSVDGGPWAELATADVESPIVVPGLELGRDHTIAVRALNPAGVGQAAAPVTVRMPTIDDQANLGAWKSITMGSDGTLYVATRDTGKVLVFAPGATGNTAPVRTISGPTTGLSGKPHGIAAAADGTIYVTSHYTDEILVFGPEANGDTAPARRITTPGLDGPHGIALDAAGNRLWVASQLGRAIYALPADASGSVAPLRTISGPSTGLTNPRTLALAAGGQLYVTDNAVRVFDTTAGGNRTPSRVLPTGGDTGIATATGLTVDPVTGTVYVANPATNASESSIRAYAPNANGNMRPIRILRDADTGLNNPSSLAIYTDDAGTTRLWAASPGNGSVRVYVIPPNRR